MNGHGHGEAALMPHPADDFFGGMRKIDRRCDALRAEIEAAYVEGNLSDHIARRYVFGGEGDERVLTVVVTKLDAEPSGHQ
jgi:hypothetical protein